MPKQQTALENFEDKIAQLNRGFDLVEYARGDIDGDRWQDLDVAEGEARKLQKENQGYVGGIKEALGKLGVEDLKIAQEVLKKNALARFGKMEEMDMKYAPLTSKSEMKLWTNQIIGARGDCYMMDELMAHTNAELAKKFNKSAYVDIVEASYNQDYAQDKLMARLAMADKLIKKGMTKERAEDVCFHGGDDIYINDRNEIIQNKSPADYKKEYDDRSAALNECINKHIGREGSTKDSYVLASSSTSQQSEEIKRIKSEFDIKQACIEYKKVAIFGSEDQKKKAQQVACAGIAEALKMHPACKDFNVGHSESIKTREKVAKMLLDQSMRDFVSVSERMSLRIKEAVAAIQGALHLGSKKSRDATKVAKNIVAGLKENSMVSTSTVAPNASGRAVNKGAGKALER